MTFTAPLMLGLLLVLPVLGKLMARGRRKQAEVAERLRGGREGGGALVRQDGLRLASLAALILALAQPVWNPHPGPMTVQGRDLVIALDISRSMLADDVFPTRLDAAKIACFESLEALRGQRIGLITFAGAASVRVPLTLDHHFVRYMLERAAPSDAEVGSTSLQAAIEKAIDIALSESKQGEQDLIIFTDGEDHISDIDTTTEELRACGARVLVVGLGDPVAGALVPEIGGTNTWMQFEGSNVVTRLGETTLLALSEESPNVSYHPARTRPFDLVQLYRQMIIDTAALPVGDETQLVYSEGYPLFIALALLLWFVPLNRVWVSGLAALMMVGCASEVPPGDDRYQAQMEQGGLLWADAQASLEADPRTGLAALFEARAVFLQAALIRPGDAGAAEQIAGVSAQIHAVELTLQALEEAEQDLQQKLQEAIEALTALVPREAALSDQSRLLLKKKPPVPPAEKAAAAPPARAEQASVGEGTAAVLGTVGEVRAVIQTMLAATYGDQAEPPPTEFDQAIAELEAARGAQRTALENLDPGAVHWPPANSAFHTATRHMEEALGLLSDQNQGQDAEESGEYDEDSEMDWDEEGDWEWSDSEMPSDMSMPMESGQFNSALESRSLPTPNYTAEEILMEEAANMARRAEQQSGRAGAQVEKNW